MSSLAQSSSTALEGWKLDDNSRSSWDILWTCLSTIFACTWTALHLSVPRSSRSDGQNIMRKIVAWIFATIAPEFMAGTASQELWVAWIVTKRCNATFKEVEQRTTPKDEASLPRSDTARWQLIHGFCLYMHGAVFQTEDRHCFPVQHQHVGLLIREGVLKPHHLRAAEIKDRAKADSLAKAFTLLQSFWVTCNIISRRAYDLPITPIEISTVAYVACAAFTYGMWWHKPRDMTTPITIPLPYNRYSEEMPSGLRQLTDSKPDLWFRFPGDDKAHVHGAIVECCLIVANIVVTCFKPSGWRSILKNEQMLIAPIDASTPETPSTATKGAQTNEKDIAKATSSGLKQPANSELEEEKGFDDTFSGNISGATFFIFITVVFCGIHVAAWNFVFPTKAEQITWRVFSLVALFMVLPGATYFFWMLYQGYQESEDKQFYNPSEKHLQAIRLFWISWMAIYSIARWGNLILMFVSLRKLPAGSYTTIDWVSSIPHI